MKISRNFYVSFSGSFQQLSGRNLIFFVLNCFTIIVMSDLFKACYKEKNLFIVDGYTMTVVR